MIGNEEPGEGGGGDDGVTGTSGGWRPDEVAAVCAPRRH